MEAQPPPFHIGHCRAACTPTHQITHAPMFHQLEGLAIDEDIALAFRACLAFARGVPRTQRCASPGTLHRAEREWSCSCFRCGGTGYEGASRSFTCKGEAWIEILGLGMVDPNVLDYVADNGYDKERVQGFAFGVGIERIRSRHEVPTCACSTRTTREAVRRWSRLHGCGCSEPPSRRSPTPSPMAGLKLRAPSPRSVETSHGIGHVYGLNLRRMPTASPFVRCESGYRRGRTNSNRVRRAQRHSGERPGRGCRAPGGGLQDGSTLGKAKLPRRRPRDDPGPAS